MCFSFNSAHIIKMRTSIPIRFFLLLLASYVCVAHLRLAAAAEPSVNKSVKEDDLNVAYLNLNVVGTDGKDHSIQCEFIYNTAKNFTSHSMCGTLQVVMDKKTVEVQAWYTRDKFEIRGRESGSSGAYLSLGTSKESLPEKYSVSVSSSSFHATATLQCKKSYTLKTTEHPSDPNFFGAYCLSNKVDYSQLIDPVPKTYRTEKLFDPQICMSKCKEDESCVVAGFEFATGSCSLHRFVDLNPNYTVVGNTDTARDIAYLPGNETRIWSQVVDAFQSAIGPFTASSSEVKSAPSMRRALAEGYRSRQFTFMMSHGLNDTLSENVIRYMARMSHSAISGFQSLTKDVNTPILPAVDGEASLDLLSQAGTELVALDTELKAFERANDTASLKSAILALEQQKIERDLAQKGFSFKFLVADFEKRKELDYVVSESKDILAEVDKSLDILEEQMESKIWFQGLTSIFKFWGSVFMLLDPLSLGLKGSVGDVATNAGDVWNTLGKDVELHHVCRELADDLVALQENLKNKTGRITAISESADFVIPFIESFQDGSFTRELSEAEEEKYLEAYTTYEPLSSVMDFTKLTANLNLGMERLCEYLQEKTSPTSATKIYDNCNVAKTGMNQLTTLVIYGDDIGRETQLTSKSILEKYIFLKYTNSMDEYMDGMIAAAEKDAFIRRALWVSTSMNMQSLLLRFMKYISEFCSLVEYFSGGHQTTECKNVRYNDDEVFSATEVLRAIRTTKDSLKTSILSEEKTVCRPIPLTPSVSAKGSNYHAAGSSFDAERLASMKEVNFQIPLDPEWLEKNGWGFAARELSEGYNFFVKGIQLSLPYATFPQEPALKDYSYGIHAGRKYTVRGSNGKAVDYMAGTNGVNYTFEFNHIEAYCHKGQLQDNLMEPCPTSKEKALPKMCVTEDGSIQKYELFNMNPTLPSLFSPFKVSIAAKEVKLPDWANTRIKILDRFWLPDVYTYVNEMHTVACFKLLKTKFTNGAFGSTNSTENSLKDDVDLTANAECKLCNAGYFHVNPYTSNPSDPTCLPCPSGTHQPKKGMYTCLKD